MNKSNISNQLDRTAVFLSGLCLLHCLAIPVALLIGTISTEWLIETETQVHWILLATAIPISGFALWRGYLRHHNWYIVITGSLGILLMFIGVIHLFGHEWEIAFTVVGVTLLLIAHLRNMLGQHDHG